MNKSEAIELLKQALNEIPVLRELQRDNQKFELWQDRIRNIIKAALDSDDLKRFSFARPIPMKGLHPNGIYQQYYLDKLTGYETALKSIIDKYEMLGIEKEPAVKIEPKDTVKLPLQLFDALQFHPKVINASRELFKDGHYRDAIYRAFVEVNNFVKGKANSQLDGRKLMSTVFSLDNPIIKLNPLETQSDRDEQEGFMFLFMGAMEGIRNPKAHENIIQNDPYRTLEYLGLASLLMKIAEEGELVERESKEQTS